MDLNENFVPKSATKNHPGTQCQEKFKPKNRLFSICISHFVREYHPGIHYFGSGLNWLLLLWNSTRN